MGRIGAKGVDLKIDIEPHLVLVSAEILAPLLDFVPSAVPRLMREGLITS